MCVLWLRHVLMLLSLLLPSYCYCCHSCAALTHHVVYPLQVFGLLIGSGYMLNHKASSDTKADYTLPVMLLCIAAAVCYGRIAMSGVKVKGCL